MTTEAGLGEYFSADAPPWGPWRVTATLNPHVWLIGRTGATSGSGRAQTLPEAFKTRADAERRLALIALGDEPQDVVDEDD